MVVVAGAGGLTGANQRALVLVYATIFLDVLGLGVLIPILPYYAQQFRTEDRKSVV